MVRRMRRYHCIIPFTGATHEVCVPPSPSTGAFTVDSLLRQLPTPEYAHQSGVPFRIDVLTTGSELYGPARGLGEDDPLPDPSDENCFLVLLFDEKYIDRFPPVRIDSAASLQRHQQRQLLAISCLLSPLVHYLREVREEHGRAATFANAIAEDIHRRSDALEASLSTLREMKLVNDPEVSLAQRIGDLRVAVQSGTEEVASVTARLGLIQMRLDDIDRRLNGVNNVQLVIDSSSTGWESLQREVKSRVALLKSLLKATDSSRKDVLRSVEVVKAVRDGVLVKILMVNSLPEAYSAAVALAKRRLVFNKAAQRVRQMLLVEHTALCEATADFVQRYGPRFPVNLIPGIHTKPLLPVFEDPVADFIRDSSLAQTFDEDPASELLVSLGLFRQVAEQPAEASTERFTAELNDLRHELDAQRTATADALEAGASSQRAVISAQSELQRFREESAIVVSDLQNQLDQANEEIVRLRELLEEESLQAAEQRNALETQLASLQQLIAGFQNAAAQEHLRDCASTSDLDCALCAPDAPDIAKLIEQHSAGGSKNIMDDVASDLAHRLCDESVILRFTVPKMENRLRAKWGNWTVVANDLPENAKALARAQNGESVPGSLVMISCVTPEGKIYATVAWS